MIRLNMFSDNDQQWCNNSLVATTPSHETHMTLGVELSWEETWEKVSRNLRVIWKQPGQNWTKT